MTAAGVAAGVGGLATGQDATTPLDPETEIVLDGLTAGWEGVQPAAIEGETNPTLTLAIGETYDVTWVNQDGQPHNIAFRDAGGNNLLATEIVSQQGAEQTVSVTVTEELVTYLCEVHPTSMVGDVQAVTGGNGNGTTTTPPTTTTTDGNGNGNGGGIQFADVPEGPTIGLEQVAGGPLTQPVSFATAEIDGESHNFVCDQTGEIYDISGDEVTEFLDITPRVASNDDGFDERGLLGLAFHPNFANNGTFYVRYSSLMAEDQELPAGFDHFFVLSEFEANGDPLAGDPDTERRLMEIPEPQFNHNAGDIGFGPDGYLYVAVGDGGAANDNAVGHVVDWYRGNAGGNGQDLTENLLGSILRIDVDGRDDGKPYGIPAENPLTDGPGLDEQYAWGFRNPWRFSWDGDDLIVADVGQNLWEEIDIVEAGGNYGWNVKEGSHCFSTESPGDPRAATECPTSAPEGPPYDGQELIDPVLEYPHTAQGDPVGISVTGGYVAGGDAVSELEGMYVFGDWSASFAQPSGRLWAADLGSLDESGEGLMDVDQVYPAEGEDGGEIDWPMQELVVAGSENGRIDRTVLAFGRDAEGALYVLVSDTPTINGNGEVWKIVSPDGENGGTTTTTTDGTTTDGTTTDGTTTDGTTTDGATTSGTTMTGTTMDGNTTATGGNASDGA